jgi:uncharacterized RDD family membrane protein YckC
LTAGKPSAVAFWIIPIVHLLDVLAPLWDKRNQTFHDKAASTIVL